MDTINVRFLVSAVIVFFSFSLSAATAAVASRPPIHPGPSFHYQNYLLSSDSGVAALFSPAPPPKPKPVAPVFTEEELGKITEYADAMVEQLGEMGVFGPPKEMRIVDADAYKVFFQKELKKHWKAWDCGKMLFHFATSLEALFSMDPRGVKPSYIPCYQRLRTLRCVFDKRFLFLAPPLVDIKKIFLSDGSINDEERRPMPGMYEGRWHTDKVDEIFINDCKSFFPERALYIQTTWGRGGRNIGSSLALCIDLVIPHASFGEPSLPHSQQLSFRMGALYAFIVWYRHDIDGSMPLEN